MAFCVWLVSLSTGSSRFICVAAYFRIAFFFFKRVKAVALFVCTICSSSMDRRSECFCLLVL